MSNNESRLPQDSWTNRQAYTLAVVCLLIGVAAGWLVRGSQSPARAPFSRSVSAASAAETEAGAQPTPEQLRQMADKQVLSVQEKLKTDPNNAELLAGIGNIYYDAQQYTPAIEYYQRALKIVPANVNVRTDLATAYWYMGSADASITEFNKALSYEPNKPNALFNLGVVKWQGKMDVSGAVAAWQKLLDTNPNFENKDKVQELIAQAQKHSGVTPASKAKPLSN